MEELFEVGAEVQVNCPGLRAQRELMRGFGIDPEPNHHGFVSEVWSDTTPVQYLIQFPDGQVSPYPASMVVVRCADE